LIAEVQNPYSRQSLKDRYIKLLYAAKKVPTNRALSYNIIKESLSELVTSTVEADQKGRDELLMMEAHPFEVPHEE